MAVFEVRGGPVTRRYLMKKSKNDLATEVLDALRACDQLRQRAEAAEARAERLAEALREIQSLPPDREDEGSQIALAALQSEEK